MLLTVTEIAALLRVHPKHVYRLIARGLPARRAGGKWLFDRDEVKAWTQGVLPSAGGQPTSAPPLIAANGDVAVELLLAAVDNPLDSTPLLGFVQADRGSALAMVQSGRVLVAGSHGAGASAPPGERLAFIHLVDREVGLARRDSGESALAITELARLRLASRPATAGVRRYLDDTLAAEGLDPALVHRDALLCNSHREVVCAVARGDADVGLASRAWAERLGLGFAPLAVEPYGLLVRTAELGRPEVVRLCEAAQSGPLRARLASVAGYAAAHSGALRFLDAA